MSRALLLVSCVTLACTVPDRPPQRPAPPPPIAATAPGDAAPPPEPAAIEMGTWDCSGSPARDVTVTPGQHVYVWHGKCGGEEGKAVVVEPKDKSRGLGAVDVREEQKLDGTLLLYLSNRGDQPVIVVVSVFVGFA
jgi:hypothetical protein